MVTTLHDSALIPSTTEQLGRSDDIRTSNASLQSDLHLYYIVQLNYFSVFKLIEY